MDNPFLGQIELFPYYFTPLNWAKCSGQLLPISSNEALFSLIGNYYGGDGRTNFKLPNLQGAEPVPGMSYYISLLGVYPQRS